jgi:hypothetical protein
MTVTSPDDIAHDAGSVAFDPAGAYGRLAASVQAALDDRQLYDYYWDDAADRAAQTGMVSGSEGFQADTLLTYKYNGTDWKAWHTLQPVAYTPTWTNLTVGNATQTFSYTLAAGRVAVSGEIILGTTSSVGAGPYMTAPLPLNSYLTAAETGNNRVLGGATLCDTGTAAYDGSIATVYSASVMYVRPMLKIASGTYTTIGTLSSTTPFAWGTGDYITVDYSYMAD